MAGDPIEATELRLLSGILALVLDEQPGQATAALDMLRRRAAQSRVTGGALKNLFDRVAAEASEVAGAHRARAEAQRLQQDLDVVTVQASRFAAENAALHQSLARAEQRLARYDSGEMAQRRELVATPRPAPPAAPERRAVAVGLLGGALFALMAMLLAHDSPNQGFMRRPHPAGQPVPAATPTQQAPATGAAGSGRPE